jgi:serine/threonine protein kinase
MVSPLMHGHLGEHIKSQETLTSSERNKLVRGLICTTPCDLTEVSALQLAEIAAELEYLHALKVTHGDVKAVRPNYALRRPDADGSVGEHTD